MPRSQKVKAKGEEPSRLIGILSGDTSPPFEQDRPEMGGDGRTDQNSEFWTFQDMLPYTTAEVSARDGGSSGRYGVLSLCSTAKATHKQTFRHPLRA